MKLIFQTAVTTCVGMGLLPADPISACAFSACVIVQVQLWDANCVPCACEWIAANRPREEYQCDKCDSCEADYHICENPATFNATVLFPNMIAN